MKSLADYAEAKDKKVAQIVRVDEETVFLVVRQFNGMGEVKPARFPIVEQKITAVIEAKEKEIASLRMLLKDAAEATVPGV